MAIAFSLSPEYWTSIQIFPQDTESLNTLLFERETPLTARDLLLDWIAARIQSEKNAHQAQQQTPSKIFLPRDSYQVGDVISFPALDFSQGKVSAARGGVNPSLPPFDVLTLEMEDGSQRMFAANLAEHPLNEAPVVLPQSEESSPEAVLREHGDALQKKLEAALAADDGLVQIAGRWFPRALLVDIHPGQLNIAEAALDVASGEPLSAEALVKEIDLPVGESPKLAEFSLNYALQNDERFDEVGPAGQILWCLRRLEPDFVRQTPPFLLYHEIEHDRSALTPEMLALESQLNDELTPDNATQGEAASVTIALIYPHLRAGTLPMSARTRKLFPTAYESPRVRFTLVDGKTKQRIPAWVVRQHGYVYGLREWYKSRQLVPGSLVQVRAGDVPGEVIVEVKNQRSSKDWVRTVLVGKDGGLVFATLKQAITAEFNDRMVIHTPDFKALDPLWEKKISFYDLTLWVMRELSKSNPQGNVHAQELYAAVNLVRRVPPAPLFALLQSHPIFKHVGDLHFRLSEEETE